MKSKKPSYETVRRSNRALKRSVALLTSRIEHRDAYQVAMEKEAFKNITAELVHKKNVNATLLRALNYIATSPSQNAVHLKAAASETLKELKDAP